MVQNFKPSTGKPTGGQSPILRMKSRLKEWAAESRTFDEGMPTERKTMSIRFKHENVQVLDATEPYPFPVAEIVIPYTDNTRSSGGTRWEAFAGSGRRVFGGTFDIDDLVGKDQEWAQLPSKLRQALVDDEGEPKLDASGKQLWGDVDNLAWQLVSVEGASGGAGVNGSNAAVDIMDYMAGLAEGLDENGFYQRLIADQKVTSNQTVVEQITDRVLVTNLTNLQKIKRDEGGILHKV